MTPGGLSPEIQEILNKYEQAPVPGGNLVNSPFTLKLGNQEYAVNSPEEAQRILDHSLTQAGTMVSQLENQVRALMAEKAALEAQKTTPPEKTDPVKPMNMDSMEFLGKLAEGNPGNAIVELAQKDPKIAQAILESSPQFKELTERLELNSFKEAHPFYAADQRTLEGLKTILKQNNLPLNAKTLELAVGHAVNQGWLPHEQVIRQQQQQQFLAMQAQQAQQGQQFNTPHPQNSQNQNVIPFPQQNNNSYAPPPRVNGGGNQGMPSIEDRVTQMFQNNNYSAEQMKQMLMQLQNQGIS